MVRGSRKRRQKQKEKRVESEVLEPNQEDVINADNLAQAKNDDLFAIDTTGKGDSQKHRTRSTKTGGLPETLEPSSEPNIDEVLDELSEASDGEEPMTDNQQATHEAPGSNVKVFKRTPPRPLSKTKQKEHDKFVAQLGKSERQICDQHSHKKTETKTAPRPNAPVDDFALHDPWGSNIASSNVKKRKRGQAFREGSKRPHIPAVEVAHPGASYNPSYEDHQDAMGEAVAAELEKQDQVQRSEKRMQQDPNFVEKLDDSDHDGSGEDEDEEVRHQESTQISVNPSTKCKRVTRVAANKRMRQEYEEEVIMKQKEEKKILEQIDRIDEINKTLTKEERRRKKQKEMRKLQREAEEMNKPIKPKRGGKEMPYDQECLQIALPEELKSSFRAMPSAPATTNLVSERFSNMVYKRGLVERGKRQPRQKAWVKFIDK